jgi:predicted transposase YbfD/YdcC
LKDQLLVIDGKRLKGVSDKEHITHLVELFAAESRLVIAQQKVPTKSGESKALPALLDVTDVRGSLVSMDALYAHISDINEVLKRGADYIVGVKGNQATLEAEIRNFFEQAKAIDYEGVDGISHAETSGRAHGRTETRHVCVVNKLSWLPQRELWHLRSLIEVRSERVIGEKVEQSIRYFGSSREADAEKFAKWIREHWCIENGLHYIMDVIFEEDHLLGDVGHSAENMSLIRRLAANIVNIYDTGGGMADARRNATYAPEYLRGLLGKVFVK